MLLRFILSILLTASLTGCDPFSHVDTCDDEEVPSLPRGFRDLNPDTFRAEARSGFSGSARLHLDTTRYGGLSAFVEMEPIAGDQDLSLSSLGLAAAAPGETVEVSVSYTDGGLGYGGTGRLRVTKTTESAIEGVFASCVDHYPMGAFFPLKEEVAGGFHVRRE